jgi:apolipoprotein N-acyltransferase
MRLGDKQQRSAASPRRTTIDTDGSKLSQKNTHRESKSASGKRSAAAKVSANPSRERTGIKTYGEAYGQTWALALMGAIFYWMSLPPMKQPWAAYFAAAFWVAIAAKKCDPSRKEYWRIWIAGSLMWLALLQGIRLAFWPLYLGWLALSLYLAAYLPIFIAMTRSMNRKWAIPLPIAAATAWVGCELIRAYFVTGFAACMLAHSQVPWPWMLPVASIFGCYGVSFMVMFLGAVIHQWVEWSTQKSILSASAHQRLLISNVTCSLLALGMVSISVWSLLARDAWLASQHPIQPLAAILLIQDDMPTQFDGPPEDAVDGWNRYEQQTALAARTHREAKIDLVVWPESTFIAGPNENFLYKPCPDWVEGTEVKADFGFSNEDFAEFLKICRSAMKYKVNRISSHFEQPQPTLLLGVDVLKVRPTKNSRYNAAICINPTQVDSPIEYYAKQHLVLFGETFPFISGLLNMLGLGVMGIDAGDTPMAYSLPSGTVISTTICFEDVLPHLIQRHVSQLSAEGKSPDILVNITNDGWFRESSILDHHLNNAILAAVENRRPMLVAANLGISAWIDGDGRVVRSLPRSVGGSILAQPIADRRWGLWQSVGDLPAKALAIVSCLPFLVWLSKRLLRKGSLPVA